MSPSLVKARQAKLQDYFKLLVPFSCTHNIIKFLEMMSNNLQVKDKELIQEPVVRIFLKLPMTHEDVEKLASGVEGDGLLGGCGTFKSLYQVCFLNLFRG